MKVSSVIVSVLAATGAVAAPTVEENKEKELMARQSHTTKVSKTNFRMWDISLPTFNSYRNAKSPSYLIWTSDGCTHSPDNPMKFPFIKACYRHDFGYRNYKSQNRFTYNNRLRLDKKLLAE